MVMNLGLMLEKLVLTMAEMWADLMAANSAVKMVALMGL